MAQAPVAGHQLQVAAAGACVLRAVRLDGSRRQFERAMKTVCIWLWLPVTVMV